MSPIYNQEIKTYLAIVCYSTINDRKHLHNQT